MSMPLEDETLDKYRKTGRIAKEARVFGLGLIRENARLFDVAEKVEGFIIDRGALPAFPVNLAVNAVAAHYTPGINDETRFTRGDLVKLDVGVHVDGFIGDTAATVEVGTNNWTQLIKASAEALNAAVEIMRPGVKLSMVGSTIERTIESYGFRSVSNLTGHGLGQYKLHAGLSVPNVADGTIGMPKPGDVLAIEPFATNGAGKVDGVKGGNIFRIVKEEKAKPSLSDKLVASVVGKPDDKETAFLESLRARYRTLPFSDRACHRTEPNASTYIKSLRRKGILYSYPILRDVGGGMVSQAEHTVIITGDGYEIIT